MVDTKPVEALEMRPVKETDAEAESEKKLEESVSAYGTQEREDTSNQIDDTTQENQIRDPDSLSSAGKPPESEPSLKAVTVDDNNTDEQTIKNDIIYGGNGLPGDSKEDGDSRKNIMLIAS